MNNSKEFVVGDHVVQQTTVASGLNQVKAELFMFIDVESQNRTTLKYTFPAIIIIMVIILSVCF